MINQTKKEQIEEFAVRNDIDIVTDIEVNKSLIILRHANGKESHIWVDIRPLVENDNKIIVDNLSRKLQNLEKRIVLR